MPAKATKSRAKKAPAKRTTVKRAASTKARKATTKKTTAKKAKAPVKKVSAIKTAFTKSQLLNEIAESTELKRKDVSNVFEALANVIEGHVKNRGAGHFTLPGLLKITVTKKPATKARKGINPFTGEPTIFKAKPARRVVKARALKRLKEMTEA